MFWKRECRSWCVEEPDFQKELKTGRKPGDEEENITCWNLSKLTTLVRGGLALNTKVRMARSFIKNIAMVMENIMMEDIMMKNMMIKDKTITVMLLENITKPARQSFQSCLLDPNQFTFRELTNLLQKVIIILMILSQLCSQTCISLCKQFLNVKGNIVSLKCLTSAVEKSG